MVVGFGPAGIFAALTLAEKDISQLYLNVEKMWIKELETVENFGKVES